MNIEIFNVDRKRCSDLAHTLFMQTSGIDREGRKFEKMRRDAFKMRRLIEERVKMRSAYVYSDQVLLAGSEAVIEGVSLRCRAFEQIDPDTVKGAYVYALTVGDFSLPKEPIMDQLYADIWGSAFADAVRLLMREAIEGENRLSDSFGPGFYGMEVNEMKKLASLLDFQEIDLQLRGSGIIVPLKSCAGLYFSVDDRYEKLNSACESCLGSCSSCRLCHVYGGIN